MEATVKRFASLLAALLTFLMINPSSANAAAPDQELLHNGHVDAALTEGDQATDRPTTQVLGDSTDLNDRDSTDISPSPDADDSIVLDHGHAEGRRRVARGRKGTRRVDAHVTAIRPNSARGPGRC